MHSCRPSYVNAVYCKDPKIKDNFVAIVYLANTPELR